MGFYLSIRTTKEKGLYLCVHMDAAALAWQRERLSLMAAALEDAPKCDRRRLPVRSASPDDLMWSVGLPSRSSYGMVAAGLGVEQPTVDSTLSIH